MIGKIRKEQLRSEIGELQRIADGYPEEYAIGKYSLEKRIEHLKTELLELEDSPEVYASAAVIFGGRPVFGSLGVEADFGPKAITDFQNIVATLNAERQGELKTRGPLPGKEDSKLYVTNALHGSFGFELHELNDGAGDLFRTPLSEVVDKVMDIVVAAAKGEEEFDEAIADISSRVLSHVGAFLKRVNQAEATLRLIIGDREKQFSRTEIETASVRATATELDEESETKLGILEGVLPESRHFEFRTNEGLVKGIVDRDLPSETLVEWNRQFAGEECIARWVTKAIRRHGDTKVKYRLLGLSDSDDV